jgi:hypothetical protein
VPRTRPVPKGPYRSFELTLSDVLLLTSQDGEAVVVPGLGVLVDHLGMTVTKLDGTVVAVLKWGTLQSVRAGGRLGTGASDPAFREAVVVEAVSATRTHRFVVPTNDPDGLEAVVSELKRPEEPRSDAATKSVGARRLWQVFQTLARRS